MLLIVNDLRMPRWAGYRARMEHNNYIYYLGTLGADVKIRFLRRIG
jgi:hypothetical protein